MYFRQFLWVKSIFLFLFGQVAFTSAGNKNTQKLLFWANTLSSSSITLRHCKGDKMEEQDLAAHSLCPQIHCLYLQ